MALNGVCCLAVNIKLHRIKGIFSSEDFKLVVYFSFLQREKHVRKYTLALNLPKWYVMHLSFVKDC